MSAGPFARAERIENSNAPENLEHAALVRELQLVRAELGRREGEIERLLATLRGHNQPELSEERRGELEIRLARAEAEAESLADQLGREQRRSASTRLLGRLNDTAARNTERALRDAERELHESGDRASALAEALAVSQAQQDEISRRARGEIQVFQAERDAALRRADEALLSARVDEFVAWFLQPRVAAGLLRRSRTGAQTALVHAAEAKAILPATSRAALGRLGRRRAILLLQARAMLSGSDRAREAVRFRMTHRQKEGDGDA